MCRRRKRESNSDPIFICRQLKSRKTFSNFFFLFLFLFLFSESQTLARKNSNNHVVTCIKEILSRVIDTLRTLGHFDLDRQREREIFFRKFLSSAKEE